MAISISLELREGVGRNGFQVETCKEVISHDNFFNVIEDILANPSTIIKSLDSSVKSCIIVCVHCHVSLDAD